MPFCSGAPYRRSRREFSSYCSKPSGASDKGRLDLIAAKTGPAAGAQAALICYRPFLAAGTKVFPSLVPVLAILIGVPLTGEVPDTVQWAGLTLVTAGLLVATHVLRWR